MLSGMEKAKNVISTALDTLEKNLNPTSGVANKNIFRKNLDTLQRHYAHIEDLFNETKVEEDRKAAVATEF
jgi:hypothetical protein